MTERGVQRRDASFCGGGKEEGWHGIGRVIYGNMAYEYPSRGGRDWAPAAATEHGTIRIE